MLYYVWFFLKTFIFILSWSWYSPPQLQGSEAWKFQMYTHDKIFPLNAFTFTSVHSLYLFQKILNQLKTTGCSKCASFFQSLWWCWASVTQTLKEEEGRHRGNVVCGRTTLNLYSPRTWTASKTAFTSFSFHPLTIIPAFLGHDTTVNITTTNKNNSPISAARSYRRVCITPYHEQKVGILSFKSRTHLIQYLWLLQLFSPCLLP